MIAAGGVATCTSKSQQIWTTAGSYQVITKQHVVVLAACGQLSKHVNLSNCSSVN